MQAGNLKITIDDAGPVRRIVAVGDLDAASVPSASGYVSRAMAETPSAAWALDMTGIEFIDSAGLHLLVMMGRQLAEDGSLVLLNPSVACRELLEMTQLTGHFTLVES